MGYTFVRILYFEVEKKNLKSHTEKFFNNQMGLDLDGQLKQEEYREMDQGTIYST